MVTQMLDYVRITLYFALIVLGLLLYQNWEKEHPISTPAPLNAPILPANTSSIPLPTAQTVTTIPTTLSVSHDNITVKTDLLEVTLDPLGGDITQVKLLKYLEDPHSNQPLLLLNNTQATKYLAESGIISKNGPDTPEKQAFYQSEAKAYVLSPTDNSLTVKLSWKNDAGLVVNKLFTFSRNSYVINMDYEVINNTSELYEGNQYLQLSRTNNPPPNHQGLMSLSTYFGGAISSPDKKFQKIPFKDMYAQNLDKTITGGWAAMIQHYFVSAWVPENNMQMQYFTRVSPDGLYKLGMISPSFKVEPGKTFTTKNKFYTGPAIADDLEQAAPDLKLTIDYGWFWFISAIIFWMMQKIYNVVGNWGWSIVLVTVIIKLLFYRLSAKSYRSMSSLKRLQPKLTQLKERYADDKQKFTQATIELYRKEKVNPMSGCLPILVQIPVFIGLYWVLIESVQLRLAPWILWIHDLSVKDPYYVLPVLMGLSMFLQQRLSPPSADPMQARVLMLMPVIFTVLFLNFPAGLMLYWFVNNTLSFLQQWYIMRSMEKGKAKSLNLA